ncbi:MAG: ribonuclease R [Clostridia bacterium]
MSEERKERILGFMTEASYKPLLIKELEVLLGVPKTDKELFAKIIAELEQEGKIFRTNNNRFGIPEKMNLIVGRLHGNERGFGFVISDDEDTNDVFISADSMNGAMHNDRVVARVNNKLSKNKKIEGEVIRILTRANTNIVGTFESNRNFGFVVSDDMRISGDIFVPKSQFNRAKPGQKVIAEITKWPEKRRNAEGKIIEVIGDKDAPGVDILSIIKAYKFSETFPKAVMEQVETISSVVPEETIKNRRDLRKTRMVTIDGEDAKDLDDAVSIEKKPDGTFRLGVHIADVSHYVTEGSPLDKEALNRGTSVYLVDRVLPMLPKELSNGICSLNPKVDRLAFTVMMNIDKTGKVTDHEIFESVINIDERMTYTDVYKILMKSDSEVSAKYEYLIDDFNKMRELAEILKEKRRIRGAIDFDFPEAKIILNEKGKPIEIKKYEITISNKIIEEFMLLCNETVAEHFFWTNTPFVYRVHEDPDSERMETFADFAHNLGYFLKGINNIHPKALQELLEKAKGTKEERILSTVMLRSLQKARYSNQNLGHFGLAARYYCHFTSPIRRYPDLIIHRMMKRALQGKIREDKIEKLNKRFSQIAKISSEREVAAAEAERDTEDLKKVEFMKSYVGDVFLGIISNVTSFGMFIELENTIEGLVRMSDMDDDYYIFNDKQFCLTGERRRKVYKIGDSIKVRLVKASMESKQIDFAIEE